MYLETCLEPTWIFKMLSHISRLNGTKILTMLNICLIFAFAYCAYLYLIMLTL
jgi:hypothetical protein